MKINWKLVNLLLTGLMVLVILVWWQWPDKELKLVFCQVGQGDSSLIVLGSYQVLVDGGPSTQVIECLSKQMPFWDRTIELVVLTHPQADHMTGLIEVVKRYQVDKLIARSEVNNTAEFWQLRQEVLNKQVEVVELVAGDKIKIKEELELEWLWPKEKGSQEIAWQAGEWQEPQVLGAKIDPNENSQVMMGRFGTFQFLLTGDIDTQIEAELVRSGQVSDVEVLKVAHHGSKYASSLEFLKASLPDLAVIGVGKNRFGHPTDKVLERLGKVEAKVLRTDEDGTVVIASDGENWGIEQRGK